MQGEGWMRHKAQAEQVFESCCESMRMKPLLQCLRIALDPWTGMVQKTLQDTLDANGIECR